MLDRDIYRILFEQSRVGLAVNNIQTGEFISVNQSFADMTGYSLDELNKLSYWDLTPKSYQEQEALQLKLLHSTGKYGPYEKEYVHKEGHRIAVRLNGCKLHVPQQETLILSSVEDITDFQETKDKLILASKVIENSSEAMMVLNESQQIITVNPAFEEVTGYQASETKLLNPVDLCVDEYDQEFLSAIEQALQKNGHWQGEVWGLKKNGQRYASRVVINIIPETAGGIIRYIVVFSDVTEQLKHREELWTQANFDSLTGLANRHQLLNKLSHLVNSKEQKPFTLLLIDLDEFKDINDTLGHAIGDKLLALVAKRFLSNLRKTDFLARHGGDEFTMILYDLEHIKSIEKLCTKLLNSIAQPFYIEEDIIHVSASIGIVRFPSDTQSMSDLLRHADQAMYRSKHLGKNQFSYFSQTLYQEAIYKHQLRNELRKAISLDQLELHFQPITSLKSVKINKAEALLRWHHPALGYVSPSEFIPIAEEMGMINVIGEWVANQILALLMSGKFEKTFQLSLNISPHQLELNNSLFWDTFLNQLQALGLAKQIIIEITESSLLNPSKEVLKLFRTFQQLGIEVAVDDFGTGYSSLSYLKLFDIDYLKIDQAFIRNIDKELSNQVLTEAMIVMAHKLGIQVVAEGVETEFERAKVEALNCDFFQGYLYAKPMVLDEFIQHCQNQDQYL